MGLSIVPDMTAVPESRELLKISEVLAITGDSRSQLYMRFSRGEIKTVKLGTAVRVPRSEVRRWLDGLYADHGIDVTAPDAAA